MTRTRQRFKVAIWFASLILWSLPLLLVAQEQRVIGPGQPEKFHRSARPIAGQYIVVLTDEAAGPLGDASNAAELANALATNYGGNLLHIYKHALNGFAIQMTESAAVALSLDPRVDFVEEDGEAWASATQLNPPWGLDRIDQRTLPLNNAYTYTNTGTGVNAYVLDTGIRPTHVQFSGRAFIGADFIGGTGGHDCHGHGTHVAGTIGGVTFGVAKNVRLYAVRVLDCSGNGSWSAIIAGVNWVTANRVSPAVANMSLGGPANISVDTAVRNSIASGVTYVVAAGNDNQPAANYSPARVQEAITVGATSSNDYRASFSNWGLALDLFAPGVNIPSAWIGSDTAVNIISGTSMATPHVAGVVAQYLQSNPGASPVAVSAALTNNATIGVVGDAAGSPNRLLYSAFIAPPSPGTLQGTVTNASSGAPIAGATVQAVGPTSATTTTNGSGQYNVSLPAGTYTVTVSASGFQAQSRPGVVISPGAPNTQNFALQPVNGILQGTVTNASTGSPINGATVQAVGPVTATTTTNGAGQYSLSLPTGTYTVSVSASGFQAQSRPGVTISPGAPNTQNFALQPANGILQGTVTNASTGSPISGATVQAVGPVTATTTTNGAGQYGVSLVPGTYTVTVSAIGFVTQARPNIVIGPGAVQTQDFALEPLPGTLQGTVTNASSGAPIAGALVQAGTFSTSTNGAGEYSLSLPPGTYTVTASATGFVSQSETGIVISPGVPTTQNFALQPETSAPISFDPHVQYAVGSNPQGLASADLNNDGALDLVVANWGDTFVSILFGDGRGGFYPAQAVEVGSGPFAVAIADLNFDGVLDLAVAAESSNQVAVLMGSGGGQFAPANYFTAGAAPRAIVIGDVSADGIPDLLVANFGSDTVSVLTGDGSGWFSNSFDLPVGRQPHALALGDLNADGALDLVVTHDVGNSALIFLSDGTSRAIEVGYNARSVAIGDLTSDGIPDLVVANWGSDTVALVVGLGGGELAPAVQLPLGPGPRAVALGDFNGDLLLDLAVTLQEANMVAILLGDGTGGFTPPWSFPVGAHPSSILVGDFNGDARHDLAVSNAHAATASVLLNTTPRQEQGGTSRH